MMSYEKYLEEWIKNSNGKTSPMGREEWERLQNLRETPDEKEFIETYNIYDEMFHLAVELDKLRCKLIKNRVHNQLLGEELALKNNDIYYRALNVFWTDKETGGCSLKRLLREKRPSIKE